MEKTAHAAAVPVSCGWSDVGSWHAVWELSAKDAKATLRRAGQCSRIRATATSQQPALRPDTRARMSYPMEPGCGLAGGHLFDPDRPGRRPDRALAHHCREPTLELRHDRRRKW